jgi:hypothetical protein
MPVFDVGIVVNSGNDCDNDIPIDIKNTMPKEIKCFINDIIEFIKKLTHDITINKPASKTIII